MICGGEGGELGLPWLPATTFLDPEGLRLGDIWYFVFGMFVIPSS